MSDTRDQMKQALKDVVVPRLREAGFAGSLPHLRRRRLDRIDLFTFQFDRHGGGFVIELAQCAPESLPTYRGKQIAPDKVKASDLNLTQRARIQPRVGSGTDSWFRYDGAVSSEDFRQTADSVLPFVEQAKRMFDDFDHVEKIGGAV